MPISTTGRRRSTLRRPRGRIGLFARRRFAIALCALAFGPTPSSAEWSLDGFLTIGGRAVEAPNSWRDGGFGVLDAGEGGEIELGTGRLSAQLDWNGGTGWYGRLALHGQAGSNETLDQDPAVTELFVGHAFRSEALDLDLRVGHFLLPTSRENVEPGWNSPFTMTFSAINTWIGEEVRPTGVGARVGAGRRHSVGRTMDLGVGVFGGNDSSGALLAWRGWVLSDRVVGLGEELSLPDLESLRSGGAFDDQRSDGPLRETLPFGDDLDGDPGWYMFGIWRPFENFSVRATHYDNRGDKQLYASGNGFEYAWSTDFHLIGLDAAWRGFEFAAEWLDGHTGMGDPANVFVRADFEAWYALISWARAGWRLSARYDDFATTDVDGASFDDNSGSGSGWTVAAFWQPVLRQRWRLGVEWLDVEADRPEALREGLSSQVGGTALQFGIRFAL